MLSQKDKNRIKIIKLKYLILLFNQNQNKENYTLLKDYFIKWLTITYNKRDSNNKVSEAKNAVVIEENKAFILDNTQLLCSKVISFIIFIIFRSKNANFLN